MDNLNNLNQISAPTNLRRHHHHGHQPLHPPPHNLNISDNLTFNSSLAQNNNSGMNGQNDNNNQDGALPNQNPTNRPSSATAQERFERIQRLKEKEGEERARRLEELKEQAAIASKLRCEQEERRRKHFEELGKKEEERRRQAEERRRMLELERRTFLENKQTQRVNSAMSASVCSRSAPSQRTYAFGSCTPRQLYNADGFLWSKSQYFGGDGSDGVSNGTDRGLFNVSYARRKTDLTPTVTPRSYGGAPMSAPGGGGSRSVSRLSNTSAGTHSSNLLDTSKPTPSKGHSSAAYRANSSMSNLMSSSFHSTTSNNSDADVVRRRGVGTKHMPTSGRSLSRRPLSIHVTGVVAPPSGTPPQSIGGKKVQSKEGDETDSKSGASGSRSTEVNTKSAKGGVGAAKNKNKQIEKSKDKVEDGGKGNLIQKKPKPIVEATPSPNTRPTGAKSRERSKETPKSKGEVVPKSEKIEKSDKEDVENKNNVSGIAKNVEKEVNVEKKVEEEVKDNLIQDPSMQGKVQDGPETKEVEKVKEDGIQMQNEELKVEQATLQQTNILPTQIESNGSDREVVNEVVLDAPVLKASAQESSSSSEEESNEREVVERKNRQNAQGFPLIMDGSKEELNRPEKPLEDEEDGQEQNSAQMKKIIQTEEEAKAALAEKRRLAREALEKEAARAEEEARLEEERLREEEAIQEKLVQEARRIEQERLMRAIAENELREEQERLRREEEQKQRLEREKEEERARKEAERVRLEMEERLKKEEEERLERKKRVEAIMSRTRTTGGGSTLSGPSSNSSNSSNSSLKRGESPRMSPSVNNNNGEIPTTPSGGASDNILGEEEVKNEKNLLNQNEFTESVGLSSGGGVEELINLEDNNGIPNSNANQSQLNNYNNLHDLLSL